MKRALPLIFFPMIFTGCAVERAQVAESAQSQMIGLPREQVLACMGPPGQRMTEGKTEVWSYGSGGKTIAHAFGDSNATGSAIVAGNSVLGSSSSVSSGTVIAERRFCVVNVVMADGAVSKVNYSGPSGGLLTGDEQCAYAVRACVKK